MRSVLLFAVMLLAISLVTDSRAIAANVMLQWDQNSETDLVGYRVYYQADSLAVPFTGSEIDVTPTSSGLPVPTSATVSNLDPGHSYVFAVTAYNSAGESSYSNIVTEVIPSPDVIAPSITAFSIPATSSSLTVAVTSFTATDNAGVTGYKLNESQTQPAANAAGWSASAPASYTFASQGTKSLYAWVKDAAGNVSNGIGRPVTISISLADTTVPVITAFSVPSTSTALKVSISSFSATDTRGVTGYMVNESAMTPSATANGWSATAPSLYTFATEGSKGLYAWAKDAAGNVSIGRSATVVVTLPKPAPTPAPTPAPATDATAPVVSINKVASPTTAISQTLSGSVTDNVGVASVTVQVGSAVPYAATLSGNSWSFNLSGLPVGTNVVTVRASDASGNSSIAKTSIVVENPPVPGTGTLSIVDATLAMQVAVGKVNPTSDQKSRLDVAPVINGKAQPDSKIDSRDVYAIMAKLVGKLVL